MQVKSFMSVRRKKCYPVKGEHISGVRWPLSVSYGSEGRSLFALRCRGLYLAVLLGLLSCATPCSALGAAWQVQKIPDAAAGQEKGTAAVAAERSVTFSVCSPRRVAALFFIPRDQEGRSMEQFSFAVSGELLKARQELFCYEAKRRIPPAVSSVAVTVIVVSDGVATEYACPVADDACRLTLD